MKEILSLQNVSKHFGGVQAVADVNLAVYSGELIGLIGPNGAGKTTIFNLITGVYTPTEGKILLNDEQRARKINGLKPYKIADYGISRTFQNIRLFNNLSVLENVLIAMHAKTNESLLASIFRLPAFYRTEQKMVDEAIELLQLFRLDNKKDELASNLAYGEQRCLEIVRALATKPKILFLDEPAAGMNPQETDQLTKQIDEIRKRFALAIVLIEHDMSLVMEICERIYVLEYGKMIAHGIPETIKNNPAVIRAYLGGELS